MFTNMLIRRIMLVLVLVLTTGCLVDVAMANDLGLGHQMLRDTGPLIGNLVYSFRGDYPFDADLWGDSNYSMIDIGQGRQNMGQCEYYGLYWTLQGNDVYELPPNDPCVPPGTDGPYYYRAYYRIGSEPDITTGGSPNDVNTAVLADLAAKYAATRIAYPNVPVTTDLLGGPTFLQMYDDSAIQAFIDAVEPDILASGGYFFFDDANAHHPIYFERLSQIRGIAIDNNLPYSMYLQTWYGTDNLRAPSASDVRFNQFTTLTFGYKILQSFIYDGWDSPDINSVLFSDPKGTNNPTALFYDVAQANTEVVNLANSLIYLDSTAVRYVTEGSLPTRTIAWQASQIDPYITAIDVNNASPNDLVVGYFEPMLESDDGPEFSSQQYFMITNCKHGKNISATDANQIIDVLFDFGSSGITSLQRLNRLTGEVEQISAGGSYDGLTYTQTGASTYKMQLTLLGGTGDLFKFYTGAFFINSGTCAEVGNLSGDFNSDCSTNFLDFAIFADEWLLCNDPEDPECTVDCTDPVYEDFCK